MQKLTELKGIKNIKVEQMPIVKECINKLYNSEIIIHNGKYYITATEN